MAQTIGSFTLLSALNSFSFLLEYAKATGERGECRFNTLPEMMERAEAMQTAFFKWVQLSACVTEDGRTVKVLLQQWHAAREER